MFSPIDRRVMQSVYPHPKTGLFIQLGFILMLVLAFGSTLYGQVIPQNRLGSTGAIAPKRDVLTNQMQQANLMARQETLVRIKDITTIEGHRTEILKGEGLVMGLDGTGGKSEMTRRAVQNMLRSRDITIDKIATGSTAFVSITAEVPPFARPGEKITASIAVMDDTSSLFGGVLQPCELSAYDGKEYASAYGDIILSGFSASGDGASIVKNHVTSGTVKAQLEIPLSHRPAFPGDRFRLLLKNKDATTSTRIATEINKNFPNTARAIDPGCVEVLFKDLEPAEKFDFVVRVNSLNIAPDVRAQVVINQKSGSIIAGHRVRLLPIMIANENLVISTRETPAVSQPAPLSNGQTVVTPRTEISAIETGGTYNVINGQATVGELATILNTLGLRPRDLIGIFQEIEASGALQAHLVIR